MKKSLIIIALLMALTTPSYASPVSQQWIKTYGGSNEDVMYCIQQTMDGGYIAAGYTKSFDGWLIDLLVLKIDTNGNVSWKKTYRYGNSNFATSIQQTTDGGYVLAGWTDLTSSVKGWILKLDGNGDISWQKAYNGVVQFTSIQQTTDGGYIASGDYLNNDGGEVVEILKLNSAGNITWVKQFNLSYYEGADTVVQTSDGGYILTVHAALTSNYSVCILNLDNDGNIIWQKSYGNESFSSASSIQQTADGGYIVAGVTNDSAMVLKLDADGGIIWQRSYPYGTSLASGIKQTSDGGYNVVGSKSLHGWDVFILHVNSSGNIIWQKSYGGTNGDFGVYFGQTMDGGIIVAGNTSSFGTIIGDLMILKLDSNGEIPDCGIINTTYATEHDAGITSQDINFTADFQEVTIFDTDTIPQDIVINTSVPCYYEDPSDIDGDGVESNPGGTMAGSIQSSSFLADGDNCSNMPNGPYLGTCTSGKIGSTCIADAACGANGICSMNQEDTFPPQGNGIGDACDCEGNFNCDTDSDVDGSDAALFKAAFGRSTILDPCNNESPCNGDFSCNGNVDGSDAALFKSDFGRSSMQKPCPACIAGVAWCSYPLP